MKPKLRKLLMPVNTVDEAQGDALLKLGAKNALITWRQGALLHGQDNRCMCRPTR
jgi:hypothetical protein